MKNIDWKDVLERSAKTFVQAAVTCLDAAKPTPEPKPPAEEEKPGDDESANG